MRNMKVAIMVIVSHTYFDMLTSQPHLKRCFQFGELSMLNSLGNDSAIAIN